MQHLQQAALILLFSFSILVRTQKVINMTVAIQITNQIYTAYLPMIETCQYNNPSISNGSVNVEELSAQDFFEYIAVENNNVFWVPITDGIAISAELKESIPQEYDGYVLYDSQILQKNRQLILYRFEQSTDCIIFDYVLSFFNTNTTTPQFTQQHSHKIQLTNETAVMVTNCLQEYNSTSNKSIVPYLLSYLGNSQYIFICKNSQQSFVFEVGIINKIGNIFQFTDDSMQMQIQDVISNPQNLVASNLIDYHHEEIIWNLEILSTFTNQSFLSFCYIANLGTNFTCINHTNLIDQMIVIINRVWTSQLNGQYFKWMDLVWAIKNFDVQIDIPGQISQVFVSETGYIFVESFSDQQTYLNIFDQDYLIAEVTYNGTIIYFGPHNFLIFNKQENSFYKLEIIRPVFYIENSNSSAAEYTSFTQLQINCQGGSSILYNFNILWTSQIYPSAYVIMKNESLAFNSLSQIFSFELDQIFLMIGPAYEIYANTSQEINATEIDSSLFTIKKQFSIVLGIQYIQNRFLRVYLAVDAQIFMVSMQSIEEVVMSQMPCGFETIASAEKIKTNAYLIVDENDETCLCINNFTQCFLINDHQAFTQLSQKDDVYKYQSGSLYSKRYLDPAYQSIDQIENRKNLYELYNRGYLISILTNNTVLLINVIDKKILSSYSMNCTIKNSTEGSIFQKQFYDPFLLIFCFQAQTITQLIIRDNSLIFQRQIPLYGFQTRLNSTSILIGYNYAFIQVDEITSRIPLLPQCCILKLDPCEFTVSVIQQIIQAKELVYASKLKTHDLAIFRNSQSNIKNAFVQVYYGNTWITLNYTDRNTSVVKSQIQIIFDSLHYNFASLYTLNITFNLSSYDLIKNYPTISEISVEPKQIQGKSVLVGNFSVNYTRICGPIFSSFFSSHQNSLNNLQIYQEDIITPTKMLGEIGVDIIQVIIPMDYNLPIANSSLNGLIFLVSENKIFVYQIIENNIFMELNDTFLLSQQQCTYNIYEQYSQNTITLVGSCSTPNFESKYPLLTLSYGDKLNITYGSIQFPMLLDNLYTLLRPEQSPIIIGIQQGPIKTKSGRLFICIDNQCQLLYISTKYQFLLDYDVYGNYEDYILISLDASKICIFLTPQLGTGQSIEPKFTLNYSEVTGTDMCSIINVYDYQGSEANIILSCQKFYYQCNLNIQNEQLTLISKYTRLPQCSLQDKFKTDVLKANGSLSMIFAVCNQNQATLSFQEFQTISSNDPIIYTGYLQIFYPQYGPRCSQNQNSPIRVIPLSTSLDYPVFASYHLGQKARFIYSQINGRLYDNNVVVGDILVNISYIPLSSNYILPSINANITNPYSNLSTVLAIKRYQDINPSILTKIIFAFLCIFSTVNILFILCAIISHKRRKKVSQANPFRDSVSRRGTGFGFGYDLQTIQNDLKERMNTKTARKTKKSRFSEIELFYIKRKE